MQVYYNTDIIWEIEQAITEASENNETIALIALDPIETEAFLEDVVALTGRGIVRKAAGVYLYRNVELKLNAGF